MDDVTYMKSIKCDFIRSGFSVNDCYDGEFHHFGLSVPPTIELKLPMNKKVITVIIQYFCSICDINITQDYGLSNPSVYDLVLHNDDDPVIRLSMPMKMIDKIRNRATFNKCREEYIDLLQHRLILFEQKIYSILES